jgi:hypothetical protein
MARFLVNWEARSAIGSHGTVDANQRDAHSHSKNRVAVNRKIGSVLLGPQIPDIK